MGINNNEKVTTLEWTSKTNVQLCPWFRWVVKVLWEELVLHTCMTGKNELEFNIFIDMRPPYKTSGH